MHLHLFNFPEELKCRCVVINASAAAKNRLKWISSLRISRFQRVWLVYLYPVGPYCPNAIREFLWSRYQWLGRRASELAICRAISARDKPVTGWEQFGRSLLDRQDPPRPSNLFLLFQTIWQTSSGYVCPKLEPCSPCSAMNRHQQLPIYWQRQQRRVERRRSNKHAVSFRACSSHHVIRAPNLPCPSTLSRWRLPLEHHPHWPPGNSLSCSSSNSPNHFKQLSSTHSLPSLSSNSTPPPTPTPPRPDTTVAYSTRASSSRKPRSFFSGSTFGPRRTEINPHERSLRSRDKHDLIWSNRGAWRDALEGRFGACGGRRTQRERRRAEKRDGRAHGQVEYRPCGVSPAICLEPRVRVGVRSICAFIWVVLILMRGSDRRRQFIGGGLEHPFERFSESWIGGLSIFKKFPYLLPCGVVAASCVAICGVTAVWFREVGLRFQFQTPS